MEMADNQEAEMARPADSDGYVTLAVLLMVGLLAAITASLLSVSRPAARPCPHRRR